MHLHARSDVGAGIAALALHGLAEAHGGGPHRALTRHQHILFRLGELIAHAEGAASLARRAAWRRRAGWPKRLNRRFDAAALAALSRIFAREAA